MHGGRIIKGKKHMRVAYNNELKDNSLEDNIYFTLDDIDIILITPIHISNAVFILKPRKFFT